MSGGETVRIPTRSAVSSSVQRMAEQSRVAGIKARPTSEFTAPHDKSNDQKAAIAA